MSKAAKREPILNVPGAVSVVLLLLVAIHCVLTLALPSESEARWVFRLAFIPTRFTEPGLDFPGGEPARYWQFFTHQLVHGDWLHLAINSAWLLAFGSGIALRAGNLRFVLFSLACGFAGILTFWAMNPSLTVPVIGASGAVSGMMAGALRFVFSAQIQSRKEGRPVPIQSVRLASLLELVRIPAVVLLVIAWIGLNYVFGVTGLEGQDAQVAWEAHLGGFLFGLLAYGWFDRRHPEPLPTDFYDDDDLGDWDEEEWRTAQEDDRDGPPPGTTIH